MAINTRTMDAYYPLWQYLVVILIVGLLYLCADAIFSKWKCTKKVVKFFGDIVDAALRALG